MGNNEMRNISKETLEKVVSRLGESFIEDLPMEPEQLLQYAKRRINPTISDNISYNLGKRMLDSRLSDEEYLITLFKILADIFDEKESNKGESEAHILISQTGAGKTKLREALLRKNPNTVVINSDLYKRYRSDAEKIMQEDPTHFGALTGIDCYDHASNIFEFATSQGYNLLIECAPSVTNGLIGIDMERLEKEGYKIQFHVLAVGDLISSIAIHYRYESDLENGNPGAKLTDLKRHNESYVAAEHILRDLNPEIVNIYRRGTAVERYIPISITEGFDVRTKIDNLRLFNTERINSNIKYASSDFRGDYQTILSSMQRRNAPTEQFGQLDEIYKSYINFLARENS